MVAYIHNFIYSSVMVFLVMQFGKAFGKACVIKTWVKVILCSEWIMSMFALAYISHNILVRIAVIVLFTLIHYLIFFSYSFVKSLTLSIISTSILFIADYGMYSLKYVIVPNMNINNIFDYTISYFLAISSQVFQLIIVILITKKFSKTDTSSVSSKDWFRYLIVPLVTLVFIGYIIITMDTNITEQMGSSFFYFAIGLLIFNLYIYYFIKNDLNRQIENEKNKMLVHHAEELQEVYHQLSSERDKLAKDNHEFKNKIVAWSRLLEADEKTKLLEMMNKENQRSFAGSNVFSTGNITVDVVLNAKYFEAIGKGISFEFNLSNLSEVKIDDTDIIILLSNVLNNAIEACEKCSFETEISVKGIVKLNRFVFTVRNSYDGRLNQDLGTTKHDKSCHGYGIDALKGIVAKYDGAVYFEHNEKEFTTFISIPLQ